MAFPPKREDVRARTGASSLDKTLAEALLRSPNLFAGPAARKQAARAGFGPRGLPVANTTATSVEPSTPSFTARAPLFLKQARKLSSTRTRGQRHEARDLADPPATTPVTSAKRTNPPRRIGARTKEDEWARMGASSLDKALAEAFFEAQGRTCCKRRLSERAEFQSTSNRGVDNPRT